MYRRRPCHSYNRVLTRVSQHSQICRSVCCRSVDVWLISNSKIDRSTDRQIWPFCVPAQSVDLSICRSVFVHFQIVTTTLIVIVEVAKFVWLGLGYGGKVDAQTMSCCICRPSICRSVDRFFWSSAIDRSTARTLYV